MPSPRVQKIQGCWLIQPQSHDTFALLFAKNDEREFVGEGRGQGEGGDFGVLLERERKEEEKGNKKDEAKDKESQKESKQEEEEKEGG